MNHYKHGGDRLAFSRQYGHDVNAILDLSVNTWPFEIPDELRIRLVAELDDISSYPDIHAERFQNAAATHHGIPSECVIPSNGSIQLIYALCSSPHYQSVITFEPTFNEYRRAAEFYQKSHTSIHCFHSNKYEIDLTSLEKLIQKNQILFICHPNNPTGAAIPNEILQKLIELVNQNDSLLIVDEAFIDFVPDRTVVQWVSDQKNLVVLRSLTKYFGLAGLRVGYAIAHPETARRMARFIPPWSVSSFAQSAGEWVVTNIEYYNQRKIAWLKETQRIMETLRQFSAIDVTPSSTSYFLFRIADVRIAKAFYVSSGQQGIMIRCCDDFSGLDQTYFRVGARTPAENQRFIEAVIQLCNS